MLGAPRLIDLKRLNREDWFRKDIVHTADGETWTLPANDLRYIMPVPQTVLDFNPDMPHATLTTAWISSLRGLTARQLAY